HRLGAGQRPVSVPYTIEQGRECVMISVEGTVVVAMDFQNDFCHPDGVYGTSGVFSHVPVAAADVITRAIPVLREAKQRRIPVVGVRLQVWTDLEGKAIGVDQFRPQ